MPVARTLRAPTVHEAALVESERALHRQAMTPTLKGLGQLLAGFAAACVLGVLATGAERWLTGAIVFAVAAVAGIAEHLVTSRKMARTPTSWDVPSGLDGWQIEEQVIHASAVVEVPDAHGRGLAWLLFRIDDRRCFLSERGELCVDGLGPVPNVEHLARAEVVLRRLWPGGRHLPVRTSGALIAARAFSPEEATWSPPRTLENATELALDRLPQWLQDALS
ncbi:hypothetical protein L6R52_12535 [Myxococcota bacterium]|nr:hypothetical protein [Myxococcota bacterium]